MSLAILTVQAGRVLATPPSSTKPRAEASLFDLSLEELMSVEITTTSASKTKMTVDRAPGTVYSFSADRLRTEGIRTLEDLLRRIPGVQLSPSRQGHTSVWIRGVQDRYNSKILLLIDSVPIRDMYYDNFLIDDMHPIELMETIEVLVGPSSVLYGANAFAGIVNIRTKKNAKEVTVSAMSDRTYSAAAHVSSDKLSIFAKYLDADDGFTPEWGRDGEMRRWDQDPDRKLGVLDIKYDLTEELAFHLGKTHYEYPFTYSEYHKTRTLTRSPLTTSVNFSHGDLDTLKIDCTAFFVDYNFDIETFKVTKNGPIEPRKYEVDEMNTHYGGVDLYASKRMADHTLLAGASLLYHQATDGVLEIKWDVDPNGTQTFDEMASKLFDPDARYWDYSLYAQDQWTLDPNLDLTVGLRYDRPDGFDDEWSGRIGLVRTLPHGLYAKALFGTAYRVPSYREFRKTDEGTVMFDPNLQPEHMRTYELALGQTVDDRTSWLVTGFYNEHKDFIADVYVEAVEDEVFFNFDERVTRGIELSVSRWFGDHNLRLTSSVTFMDAWDCVTREELHALSSILANVNLTYDVTKDLRMGLTANYVGRPHVDDDYQTDVPAEHQDADLNDDYFVLGAYANYRFNKNIEFQLAGRNITNEKYYSPHYGPSSAYDYEWPGAFVSLSLVIRH